MGSRNVKGIRLPADLLHLGGGGLLTRKLLDEEDTAAGGSYQGDGEGVGFEGFGGSVLALPDAEGGVR
ncbi:MAG: hypothetical protein Q8R91_07300 [Candidatus Omnitrophota bacterium]|nr:hypothetical protein [Candidatus Omnitrophota bacterium]